MRFHSILIVEDDAALRQVIARNFRVRGHAVAEAETAEQALAHLALSPPDLMLLDINLPDRTGWDVLRALKKGHREVPTVIASSADVTSARLAEFRPLAYLAKPFPVEALLRVVESGVSYQEEAG